MVIQVFPQFGSICIAITNEFQEKLPVMTAVRHMKNSSIASPLICPCHNATLSILALPYSSKTGPNNAAKPQKQPSIRDISLRQRSLAS